MAEAFNRNRLRKLLGMLGSAHDGEVLNAARRIDEMVQRAGLSWDTLIADDRPVEQADISDLERLDELINAETVSDVLKIRLKQMRDSLRHDHLSEADRRFLRVLHRKTEMNEEPAARRSRTV